MNKKILFFSAVAVKDDIGYASDFYANGLFKVNMRTGECIFIARFRNESIVEKRLFVKALWINDDIFFIPASAGSIHVYNVKTKRMNIIPIPLKSVKEFCFYSWRWKFADACVHNGKMWLIPSTYPGIVSLNLTNMQIEIIDDWIPKSGYLFRSNVIVDGETIIIPDGRSNLVLMFSLETRKVILEHIGEYNNGAGGACKVGDEYFFSPRVKGGSIICWNKKTKEVVEYTEYPEGYIVGELSFARCFEYGGKVYFPPIDSNYALVMKDKRLEVDRSISWKRTSDGKLGGMFHSNGFRYYVEFNKEDRTFRFDLKNGMITDFEFYTNEGDWYKTSIILEATEKEEVIQENKYISLEDILTLNG